MSQTTRTRPRAATGNPIVLDARATYSQPALAAALGVSERTVRRWRRKRGAFPRPFTLGTGGPKWTGAALLNYFARKQQEAQS